LHVKPARLHPATQSSAFVHIAQPDRMVAG
jgi:hypothetical protein